MLSSILKLLSERGTLSVQELALVLKIDSSALHPMLEMLVAKGKIEPVEIPCKSGCGGCSSRCGDAMVYYKCVPAS